MAKKVVIIGGGFAGAKAALTLEKDFEVTLVDSKDYFEIKWAALRIFVEPSIADQVIFPHSKYLKNTKLVVGVAKSVSPQKVELEDGTELPFDYLIIASGSKPGPKLTAEEKIAQLMEEAEKVKAATSFLIVGGGPVGVEFAGEVLTDYPDKKVTIVHSGERLLEFVKPKASAKALKWLESKGATVLLNDRVEDPKGSSPYSTKKGKSIEADYVFWATGSRPDTTWLSGLPDILDESGRVKVGPYFQVDGYNNIFALGDVTDVKEAKQGYLALIHAKTAAFNILKSLVTGTESTKGWKKYALSPELAIVSLGRGDGVAQLPFGTFTGWLPRVVKSKTLFIAKTHADLGFK